MVFTTIDARAEDSALEKPRNKNAEKVIAVLKVLDIEHPYLTQTAEYVDANTEDGYFYLTEQEVGSTGIQMQIRYDVHGFDADNLQINFTEKGANYNLTGSREGLMYTYSFKF